MTLAQPNSHGNGPAAGLLPLEQFQQAVAALPLVSVDWVLTNTAGELLVGQRLNAPARGAWFTPGGRIRKGEALALALGPGWHKKSWAHRLRWLPRWCSAEG